MAATSKPGREPANRGRTAAPLHGSTVPRFHGSAVSCAATAGLHGSTAEPWNRGAEPWPHGSTAEP